MPWWFSSGPCHRDRSMSCSSLRNVDVDRVRIGSTYVYIYREREGYHKRVMKGYYKNEL